MNRILRFVTSALVALTVTLGAVAPAAYAQVAPGPVINAPAHPDKAPAPQAVPGAQANNQAVAPAFDGKALYKAAFEVIRDSHILLADPTFREAWIKEWEHKFDASGELATEEGADKALLQLMQSLKQRYDYFMNKAATEAELQEVDATLVGIGTTLRLSKLEEIVKTLPENPTAEQVKKALAISDENRLMIEEPIPGGPAEKAGLKPGDVIKKVDGAEINGKSMSDVVGTLKGKADTTVEITVERTDDKGVKSEVTVKITRAKVTVPVVTFKYLGDGVSYVRLRNFMSQNTMTEFRDALKKAANGKAVVIDLRGNPGGSLTAVLTITGMVLPEGPVLITKSRSGDAVVESEINFHRDFVLRIEPDETNPGNKNVNIGQRGKLIIPEDMPIIVLVDEGSASASEILSGVLQHNKRAIVIGKPTVGKGVGQSVIDLPFGRRLHVTTFEFIPGRTPNDWIGVIPDLDVERGTDPKVDGQLERARSEAKTLIEAAEARKAKRVEQEKKHRDEFEKQLQKR